MENSLVSMIYSMQLGVDTTSLEGGGIKSRCQKQNLTFSFVQIHTQRYKLSSFLFNKKEALSLFHDIEER